MLNRKAARRLRWLIVGALLGAAGGPTALAQRPAAPRLLPENTLAYVRVADAPDLIERYRQTALGRIVQDESIRPMVGQLYASLVEAFSRIEEQLDVPLDRLLALPQGEICAALVAPPEGRPVPLLLADVGDQLPTARKLLERAETLLAERGATRTTEEVGQTRLTVLTDPADLARQVVQFERDGTIAIVGSTEVAKQLLVWWDGERAEQERTLADNRKFSTIMNRSRGTRDEPPQITWFVDPIELARTAARDNFAAQAGLAVLPALGLDGLQAVGGSIILATEDFDNIVHLHVLLDSPRAGVIEMLALESGETTPELWVPADVGSYATLHWDVQKTYRALGRLYNSFRGEEALKSDVQRRISNRLGIDFENELVNQLDGRFTHVTWIEPPARLNSQVHLVAMKLKDAEVFRATLQKIADRFRGRLQEKTFGGITYYQAEPRQRRQPPDDPRQPQLRPPQPCLAIVDDSLIFTGSAKLLEQVILTKRGAADALADELEYKLIAGKIKRQFGGSQPGLVAFNRPEKAFRLLYDLLGSEDTQRVLAARSGENQVFKALRDALQDHPLPPFAELSKYLAPGGAMVTNDETGFHYLSFTLKRE